MTNTYILLKDSPSLKKGAILIEDDDGSGDFVCRDPKFFNFKGSEDCFYKNTVMKNSEWFEEIYLIQIPKSKVAQAKKILKKNKIL